MSGKNIITVKSAFELPASLKGGVIAIGNFDGVHRGHMAVLGRALELANKNSAPAIVLTFEPHPRTFFNSENPVFRLSPAKMKAELLGAYGFNCVVEHSFDKTLSSMNAQEFVDKILVEALGAIHVVAGYDFHFGKARSGTPEFLKNAADNAGFKVDLVDAFSDENSDIVSSSRIRNALADGDISLANGLLGFAFRIEGTVEKGKQIGRDLGYPTANIILPKEADLKHGIYAVRVRRPSGELLDGVASYGRRPTFDNGAAIFETFLFDFAGDLYGEDHTVFIHAFLRGEEKFENLEDLIKQMDQDSQEARAVLSALSPDHGIYPAYIEET